MATEKALIIKESYLHNEDALGLDDVTVRVNQDGIDLTTKRGNAFSFNFDDLAAINRLVAEKRPVRININVNTTGLNAAMVGLSTGINRAVREAAQQEQERHTLARCRCAVTPMPQESSQSWPPDWSKIDAEFKFAAVDRNGSAWVFEKRPVKFVTVFLSGIFSRQKRLGKVVLPPGLSWEDSLCERPTDELAFLSTSWADVPDKFPYVAADENGSVWGYQVSPSRADNCWYASGSSGDDCLCTVDPTSFGDWRESLRIRPGHMTNVLGITWADVPAEYPYVAADRDGRVFGYADLRPIQDDYCWWSSDKASLPCRYLRTTQLPPNLSWRNTLFVRPGYTEPVTPIGL